MSEQLSGQGNSVRRDIATIVTEVTGDERGFPSTNRALKAADPYAFFVVMDWVDADGNIVEHKGPGVMEVNKLRAPKPGK